MSQGNVTVWGAPLGQVVGPGASPPPAPALPPAGNVPWAAGPGPQNPAAPPTSAPAEAPPQGPNAYDQALARVTAPGAGGPPHPAGLSKVDQEQVLGLVGAASQRQGETEEAIAAERKRQADLQEHSDAVLTESKIATDAYLKRQQEIDEHRKVIYDQAADRQTRIEGEISRQQAQGIDPNKYLHDQTTAQKFGAAFAIGLGGFAAGPLGPHGTRGVNAALQIYDNAISRELDAQRENMHAHLELLGKRLDLNREGFNRDAAEISAERDSGLAAYTVAIKDAERRGAMYASNAEAQRASDAMVSGLQERRAQYVDTKNQQLVGVLKLGERPVGGGGIDRAKLLKDAAEYKKTALANGKDITQAEALRRAAEDQGIQDPNLAPRTDISKVPAGGKGALGRGLVPLAKYESAATAAQELESLLAKSKTGYLTPAEMSQAQVWNKEIEDAGGKPVDVGMLRNITGSSIAAARANRAGLLLHARNIRAGAAGGGEAEAPTPEDLGAEEQ